MPDNERSSHTTRAEWIRHCRRTGLYEQGRLLYERGGLRLDSLSEEAQVAVEEDYRVCVRMMAREGAGKKARRGRDPETGQGRLFQ
ncbi:MAG: hypothetical protein Q8O86_10775 [Dehalococcoidia bacterium]|nr:hypothetical protein [Dehalococcoidia bacterium]